MKLEIFKTKFSEYLEKKIPFFFLIDYECKQPFICELNVAKEEEIFYDIKGNSNVQYDTIQREIRVEMYPIDKEEYAEKFRKVKEHLSNGNTYLLNLTFPTEIKINLSLKEIFQLSKAPYKLYFKNKFVVFSPECFVRIKNNEITSYPMKGTIDASVKNAESLLLQNKKEEWEHNTIVDLLRNDLSIIADSVCLTKYRYIDRIKTHSGELLQTSSEIKGLLKADYRKTLGYDLFKLLPAGSISGAPKEKTIEVIRENEVEERGYYTGIFGIFNGEEIDSAVNIRFIENKKEKLYFRSGGGITSNSELDSEYSELLQKIYIPTFKA